MPNRIFIRVLFPAPVLAEDRVNLPGTHFEVDVVVGHHAAEALRDANQLDHLVHISIPTSLARGARPHSSPG